jgi:TIR domain
MAVHGKMRVEVIGWLLLHSPMEVRMAQMRVFVSHTSSDKEFCQELVAALRTAGADVWYDEHNLGIGVLREEIMRQLAERPAFIVVVSKAALASRWVRDECEWTYNLYRRPTTPGSSPRLILPVVAGPYDPDDFNNMLYLESMKRVEAAGHRPYPTPRVIQLSCPIPRPRRRVSWPQAFRRGFNRPPVAPAAHH